MNKIFCAFLLIALALLPAACKRSASTEKEIVCTTYPVWLITRDLMQGAENPPPLSLLVPPDNGCPHDFALDTNSMIRLSRIKTLLLLRNGGLDDILADSVKKLNPKTMDHPIITHAGHDHGKYGICSQDPHIFTAPGQAKKMVLSIANSLMEFNPANNVVYAKNEARLLAKLDELEATAKDIGKGKKILAMHSTFSHLLAETGFNLRGVIFGGHISALSPVETQKWINMIKQEKIAFLITEPQTSRQVAEQLRNETGISLLELDPAASGAIDVPAEYLLKTMEQNIAKLREAAAK
ncbi:MAG: zinc ABC transporter substrate-binding protein [Lentisphaeria bacterium]|nr:zinc ABC transporter substrate-binding protein [Lentisphaeria bacterium]